MKRYICYSFLRHRRRSFLRIKKHPHRLYQILTQRIFWLLCLWMLLLPAASGLTEFLEDYDTYETYTHVPKDPVFLTTDTNITVREGGKAELPCSIQHLGTKKVAWRRVDPDKFLTIGKMAWTPDEEIIVHHVKHSEELDDWTLVLPKVKKSDAGLYECQLTSVVGYHTHVRLNVVGPPITSPEVTLTGTQFVERGGLIQLHCNATGGLQIAEEIDWFKDGNIISGSKYKDYVIFTYRSYEQGALVSTLQVDRANANHAGTYVCRSSYNKLKDIAVQVLVADSSNVKRGMSPDSSPNSSRTASSNLSSLPRPGFTVRILLGLTAVVHLTLQTWLVLNSNG